MAFTENDWQQWGLDPPTIWLTVERTPLLSAEIGIAGYVLDGDTFANIPAMKDECFRHANSVIESPTVIFQDLNRTNYGNALVYSSVPSGAAGANTTRQVVVAYAVLDEPLNAIVVIDIDHRIEDFRRPGYPQGWETMFGDRLWPND